MRCVLESLFSSVIGECCGSLLGSNIQERLKGAR